MTAPAADTLPGDAKKCPGIPTLGVQPHVALLAEFNRSKAQKDGYARLCRPHRKVYEKAWRGAQPASDAPTVGEQLADAATAATGPMPARKYTVNDDGTLQMEPPVPTNGQPDAGAAARKALEAELASNGGAETAEGQALLKQAADDANEARRAAWREAKRVQRAAAKAAKAKA